MSDSGKCKRNRRNRGNRRKNKNKEAAGPVTESENICEQTEVSGQLDNNVGENSQISDKETELDRNAVENKSQEETQTTDLDEHEKESPELINKSDVSKKSNNVDADIDYEIVSSYDTLSAIKLARYQVEFPQLAPICKEKKKLKNNNKSKSLDNDDDPTLNIVDITEIDMKSDDEKLAESNAIISEAESDVEWEVADDLLQVNKQCGQKIKGQLSVETIPLQNADSEEVNSLSPEEEINLRNFLQTLNLSTNEQKIPEVPDIVVKENKEDKESESDMNMRRARKKAALEEHFLPQIVNPRFLDVIDEEGSNESSDTTRRQSFLSENRELQQRYDDLDDDVFITEKKAKEPKDIFPKNKDYFACKKELKRQQECLLVGAKILESEVEEGCGDWTIEKTEEQRGADIVFLDDSSSSASEIDNGGETDFLNEDERVTIKTPTIEIDCFYSNSESRIPTFSQFNTEKLTTKLNGDIGHGIPKDDKMNTNMTIPSTCLPTVILSTNEEISESLESLLVLSPIPAACNEVTIMANEFVDELPIVTEVLNENSKSIMIKDDDDLQNDVDKLHQAIEIELNTSNVSGLEDSSNTQSLQRMDNPTPLKTLCLNKVASLPYGESIIEELASASESLKHLTQNVKSDNWKEELPTTMPFYPLPDLSAIKKAALLQHQTSKPIITCQVEKIPPPINPRQSSFKVLRDDPPWVGLASHTDPTLLACLSPSQKSQIERSKNMANDEAGELIDMHCKYAERRGYHETNAKAEKSVPVSIIIDDNIPVQASGGDGRAASSPGSTNRLLAIIRDPTLNPDAKQSPPDQQSSPQSTFDFMETLRSFEDLNNKLAKEEKNISVTKKSGNSNETLQISESYSSNQSYKANIKKGVPADTNCVVKDMKFSDFPPVNHRTSSKDEKYIVNKYNNIDISNHSTNTVNQTKYRYNSTGNLNSHLEDTSNQIQRFHNKRAFLLDDPIFETFSEKVKNSKISTNSLQNGVPKRRSSLPKELHDRQIAYIVQKEKEIEEQIRQLENQKRITNFDNQKTSSGPRAPMMKDDEFPAEKYNISRQRDIAIIQQEMEEQFVSSVTKSERPIPVISAPSNGEKFRDQMYSEYLDKVAEREERKHHKVIKISNSQDNLANINILNDLKKTCNKIEEEFISKAKMRWDKLGFKDPETEDENDIEVTKKSDKKDNLAAAERQPVVIEHKIKVIEGDEEKDVQKLPNHLQEFVKFTSSGNEAGVWSPGGSVYHPTPSFNTVKSTSSGSSLPSTSATQNGGSAPLRAAAQQTQPQSTHQSLLTQTSQNESTSQSTLSKTEINELQSLAKVTSSCIVSNGLIPNSTNSSGVSSSINASKAPVSNNTTSVSSPSSGDNPPPPPPPPLPVWTPRSQPPSPAQERKEFKPVTFDSPTLQRKQFQEQLKSEAPPPWESRLAGSRSAPAAPGAPGLSGLAAPPAPPPPPSLPRAQNPTITLLQKAREGQLPRGAAYLQQDRERDPPRDRKSPPRVNQGEVVYSLRREYASDTESGGTRRRMAEPKKYEGIGPTTKEGMPIVLRSEVKEGNQSKWYKKMYDTIHRNKFDDDYVTVRYKSRRAHPSALHSGPRHTQYAYFDPRSGYLSEPEGGRAGWSSDAEGGGRPGWNSDAYDSDASARPGRRHSTLDRRGKENGSISEFLPTTTKYSTLASAKASQEVYKNQPGRIEDYIPGRSSVVDKEAKQQLANASVHHPQMNNKQSVSSSAISKSYMARALKESGYESDSTLVFRRRGLTGEADSAPLSPREQRQAYRELQVGGDPPLQGFRKPAPDRPKEPELAPIPPPKGVSNNHYNSESPRRYVESDVNIHYRVPVRQEPRPMVPEEELARRQADHMRRVYQEERRRKYLQELQDMNSRRHTDNFTAAQKSPISLNRYDTFGSTGQVRPHQVARALHNFSGQSPRELSFRRGELVLVRRRIDQNWFEGEHDGQVGLFPTNYVELIENEAPQTPTGARPGMGEGRARAKFNFVAQTHLELGLKKGELVALLRRVDDNWYEGKLAGRKGIFPVSYVEVLIEPQPNRGDMTPSLPASKPVASPAAHSVMGAAGAASLGAHHYTPQINSPALSNSPSSTAPLTLPNHGITNHHARPASATLPRAADPSPVNLNNHEPLYVDTNAEAVPYRAMYKYRPQNPDELELTEGDTVYVLEKCDDGWYVGSSQRTGRFGTFPGNYVEKI